MDFERRFIVKDVVEHKNNFHDKREVLFNKRILARLFDFSEGVQDTDFDFTITVANDGIMVIKDNEQDDFIYLEKESLDFVKTAVDLAIKWRDKDIVQEEIE